MPPSRWGLVKSKVREWILAFLQGGPKTGEEMLAALMAEEIGSRSSLFRQAVKLEEDGKIKREQDPEKEGNYVVWKLT